MVGASAGVFALLTAHLADVFLNKDIMESKGLLRILGVLCFIIIQLIYSLLNINGETSDDNKPSYIAHLVGSLQGVNLGLFILKDFIEDESKFVLKKTLLCVTVFILLFEFFFNLIDQS